MKKNILFYFAGILTGIILTILIAFLFAKSNMENENGTTIEEYPGITIFDKPAGTLDTSRFEVFQVIKESMALARCKERQIGDNELFTGPIVLLIDENKHYYDDEIIDVPQGKQAQHVGTFQYQTNRGIDKTVPVIRIM